MSDSLSTLDFGDKASDLKQSFKSLGNTAKDWLLNTNCPVSSIVIWIGFYMGFYYSALLSDKQIESAEKGITVKTTNAKTRATLAVVWVVGGLFAGYLTRWACRNANNNWTQLLWGVVFVVGLHILSILVLAITRQTQNISDANQYISFLQKQGTCTTA